MEPVAVELPAEALALIEAGEPFDVAVLDMMMPEMDGLALAREIRAVGREQELPLVLLTSLGRLPAGRVDRASSRPSSRSRSRPRSSTTRSCACSLQARRGETVEPRRTGSGAVVAADPARRGQRREPEGRAPAARAARLRADVVWNGLEALGRSSGSPTTSF